MSSASKNLLNFLISNHIETDFQSDKRLEVGLQLQIGRHKPEDRQLKRVNRTCATSSAAFYDQRELQ
jgi:hypothetical protein